MIIKYLYLCSILYKFILFYNIEHLSIVNVNKCEKM